MSSSGELSGYMRRAFPDESVVEGRYAVLEPILDESRFDDLWNAFSQSTDGAIWRWLFAGPFSSRDDFLAYARATYFQNGHRFYAIIPKDTGQASGVAALFRADLDNGAIELGHVCLGPSLQRTRDATEAFVLMMKVVLGELGYRRLEWKCNSRNEPSKRAAARLGFTYEGTFRQHMIAKGENRDSDWFSIIDAEWPRLEPAFEQWLSADNFDPAGRQRQTLASLTAAARPVGQLI